MSLFKKGFKNPSRAIIYLLNGTKGVIKDPSSAIIYLLKGKKGVIKKKISSITRRSYVEVENYYMQSEKSEFISHKLQEIYLGQISRPEWIYTICRILKPTTVLETGVSSGMSSAFILKALEDNNKGRLVSIDMPKYSLKLKKENSEYSHAERVTKVPDEKETGWLVPDDLRHRWTLKLGLVQNLLLPTLDELHEIDMFFHDSEHTYQNMMFEFRNAWSHLRKGGILLSHDISWNTSFAEFAKKVNRKYIHIYFTGAGAILK